jgi:Ca2+-binding RTX toxin-like protein
MLQPGGFSFVTLIHEFGHGMGLAHPHDTGGGSSVMPGVNPLTPGDDGGKGTHGLNQGVYTMMSYNDGWEESPYGLAETNNEGYGWLGSLMALDIAVIQDKYGVNEEWATGNDTYVLKDANQWGVYIDAETGEPAVHDATNADTTRDGYYVGESTSYRSIWDAGGIDEISYVGIKNTVIDLRAATLQYETPGRGGGGYMSYAFGIHGGFTIANGVTIENATTDAGNDVLWDNGANNVLSSGGGNDALLVHGGGTDSVIAGTGNDFMYFGAAFGAGDTVDGGTGNDTLSLLGAYTMTFGASQLTGVERLVMYSGSQGGVAHNSYNLTTIDANVAAGTQLGVIGRALLADEAVVFNGAAETDGSFRFNTGLGGDTLVGGAQADSFTSGGGDDQLFGLAGDDWMYGGAGGDAMRGGTGHDRFIYQNATDSVAADMDHILDFQDIDRIDLSAIDANGNLFDGNTAFSFIGSGAFTNSAGQLRAYESGGSWYVEGDVNGDGTADLMIQVTLAGPTPLGAEDFVL